MIKCVIACVTRSARELASSRLLMTGRATCVRALSLHLDCDQDVVGTLVNVWSTRERRVDYNGIRRLTTKVVESWKKTASIQSLVP